MVELDLCLHHLCPCLVPGECLAGALYWRDLYNIAEEVGFSPPCLVTASPITISNKELETIIGEGPTRDRWLQMAMGSCAGIPALLSPSLAPQCPTHQLLPCRQLPLRLCNFPPVQGARKQPGWARTGHLQWRDRGARARAGVRCQLHLQGAGRHAGAPQDAKQSWSVGMGMG